MRLEPQDPTMWFEGARRGTVGAFHERNITVQKTVEVNGNPHPRKCAFGCLGGLYLISHGVAVCRTLHPCLTVRARVRVRRWIGCARSIGVMRRGRSGARNRYWVSK